MLYPILFVALLLVYWCARRCATTALGAACSAMRGYALGHAPPATDGLANGFAPAAATLELGSHDSVHLPGAASRGLERSSSIPDFPRSPEPRQGGGGQGRNDQDRKDGCCSQSVFQVRPADGVVHQRGNGFALAAAAPGLGPDYPLVSAMGTYGDGLARAASFGPVNGVAPAAATHELGSLDSEQLPGVASRGLERSSSIPDSSRSPEPRQGGGRQGRNDRDLKDGCCRRQSFQVRPADADSYELGNGDARAAATFGPANGIAPAAATHELGCHDPVQLPGVASRGLERSSSIPDSSRSPEPRQGGGGQGRNDRDQKDGCCSRPVFQVRPASVDTHGLGRGDAPAAAMDELDDGGARGDAPLGGMHARAGARAGGNIGDADAEPIGVGGHDPAGFVERIRTERGLSVAHAQLLATAARGCPGSPDAPSRTSMKARVRGVFPLPYRLRQSSTESPTLRAGSRRRGTAVCRAVSKFNLVVGLLNLLFGGVAALGAGLGAGAGAAQLSATARIHRMTRGWDFSEDLGAVDTYAGQPLVDYAMGAPLAGCVDTVPELVKLPEVAGTAALLDLLPDDLASRYRCEANVVQVGVHLEAAELLRDRCFTAPALRRPEHLHALARRMLDAGMLAEVPDVQERVGMFTVERPDGRQRLVVDPRATNVRFGDPPPVQLAAGALLARQIQRGRTGSGSTSPIMHKSDLSDYYYQLRIPSWMSKYFVIPPVLRSAVGLDGPGYVDLGFTVLPMGCSHAVALAQEAHMEVLRRAGLPLERKVTEGEPLLSEGPFFAVQIDDLVLVDPDGEPSTIDGWLQLALNAYRQAGLPVAEKKVERDTTRALGMEIHQRTAGAPREKRQRLVGALLAVSAWPRAPARLIESLVGHATYHYMFWRPGLAAFGHGTFGLIQHAEDLGCPLRASPLSPRCRWELITAAALLPFAQIDLAAPVSCTVLAMDASPYGYGVVRAQVHRDLVASALRHGERRGEFSALDGGPARRIAQGDRVLPRRALAGGWEDVEWSTLIARPWRRPQSSQALGELQAYATAAEYAARRVDLHGSQLLMLSDARAVVGATAKGRSSSWGFLAVLRRQTALACAVGVDFVPRWICTDEMPADEPSRRFAPRQPSHDWKRGARLGEAPRPGPEWRPLRGARLKRATLISYLVAFVRFAQWAGSEGHTGHDVPAFEHALMSWLEHLHESGLGAHTANCAFGAIKVLSRRVYDDLPDARGMLADFNGLGSATHWPPVLFPAALVLAEWFVGQGDYAMAIGSMLQFIGLLRISELMGLTVGDVVFPEDGRLWGINFVLLALKHTKTGDDLSAEIRFPWLWPVLRWWVRMHAPGGRGARLFPQESDYRARLRAGWTSLGLGHLGYVPHSFRAGGALFLLNQDFALDEVLRRGRWRKPESARPYLQRLAALGAQQAIDPALLAWGSVLARCPGAVFRLGN